MSQQLDDQAREILRLNDRGGYTIPTARLYPYQWNWDSAFVALGFLSFDRDRAWIELELLLEGQWANGMIPSIIFRSNDPDYFPGPSVWQTQTSMENPPAIPSTGISQPPVLASIVWSLVNSGDIEDKQRAVKLLDKLVNYHLWFQNERTSNHADIVGTVHPWETGRDNCPDWDLGLDGMNISTDLDDYVRKDTEHANPEQRPSQEQYDKYVSILQFGRDVKWDQKILTNTGPFLMADPGIHFILLRANKDLLKLAELLEQPEQIAQIQKLIEHGTRASNYFWNEHIGAYTARNILTGEFSNGFSNASALCFYAGVGSEEQQQRTLANMTRIGRKVNYMMPSWDPDAPQYDPQRYWCGPIWPQMNYMISMGLEEQGQSVIAGEIRNSMAQLIQKSGFYECFNPVTGEGCIGENFSWTAAIWLAWASPSNQTLAA